MALSQIAPVILDQATALTATEVGAAKAREIGTPYTLVVLDGAGLLVNMTRMDGAALASIDTSIAKARTAVSFGAATLDLAAMVVDGQPLSTIQTATTLPLAFVSGGVPITDAAGVVIGAVGAGGGTPDQDEEVARAAVAAVTASG